jgi:diguanylate cyclase (GGDEF)-like protein
LQSGHHDKKFYEDMWTTLTEDGEWINEMWNRHKDGGAYLQRLSIKKIEDSKGRTVHFLALFQDITEIRHNDKQLKHQANHDPLTNLPNRQLFKGRLERAIADACRHKEMTAVLYLELVNFKNINTSFGHHFGDIFLKDITVSIKSLFRDQDTVARIGGVEFAIVLPPNTDAHGARVVANKLIELFKKRFIIDNKEFFVGVRIGITIYPTDGESVEPLMKNAVLALSDAKKQDKNSYAMFTSNMDVCALRRASLAGSLFRALDRNEFSVYFQQKWIRK